MTVFWLIVIGVAILCLAADGPARVQSSFNWAGLCLALGGAYLALKVQSALLVGGNLIAAVHHTAAIFCIIEWGMTFDELLSGTLWDSFPPMVFFYFLGPPLLILSLVTPSVVVRVTGGAPPWPIARTVLPSNKTVLSVLIFAMLFCVLLFLSWLWEVSW